MPRPSQRPPSVDPSAAPPLHVVERRAHVRRGIRLEIEVHADGRAAPAVTRDVSVDGMQVVTDRPLPFLAECWVRCWLAPLREEAEVRAVVRWTADDRMGIQFRGLRARHAWALHRMLETPVP